ETVHEDMGDGMERAATTAANLDAEQDSGTINRTQSTAIPNEPIPQGTGSSGSPRIKYSAKKSLGDQKDASNQGRNMAGFTHNQLKNKSFEEKLDEKVEAELDNDQEEAEMKMYMKIVFDDEVAIDAIPLATKPPIIVDWKIIKEGKISSYHIIRADGSSKRYSSMIYMLQNINKEDLETLWKLVKAKYGNPRPEEAYERVL
nr:hypothetical protein [Tanacetum cinerariifolium]